MKKVTLTDLNGKEIEVFFADDKTVESTTHNDKYKVKVEDIPSNKNWAEMTGGDWEAMNEMNVNENSAWPHKTEPVSEEGLGLSFYESLNKKFLNKVKGLEEPQSQISIDDTIPSDFVELSELRNGAIYKVAGLNLIAKLVNKQFEREFYKPLLKMKRHGIVFYVEEGSLMRATDLEVQTYLEESN